MGAGGRADHLAQNGTKKQRETPIMLLHPSDKPIGRRPRFTPDRLVLLLLVAECLLWLSNWLGWPAWHKGYAVLTCVAMVGMGMIVMLLWFGLALIFRRRFQFGIRTLLVLAVVIAIPCRWMTAEMKKADRQQVARTAFQRFPGYVEYGYERSRPQTASPAPSWLRRLLGDDFFADATLVCLACDKRFTDADMAYVKSLPRLKMLRLFGAVMSSITISVGTVHPESRPRWLSQQNQHNRWFGTKLSRAAISCDLLASRATNLAQPGVEPIRIARFTGKSPLEW